MVYVALQVLLCHPKQVIKWISELNINDIQNQFRAELINSLRKLITKTNPFENKMKIVEIFEGEPVKWLVDDPENCIFSKLKLINMNSETFVLSDKAVAIAKVERFIELTSIDAFRIDISSGSTIDILYEYYL